MTGRIRYKRLVYKIDQIDGDALSVHGYAIQLPPPFAGLRFCARRITDGSWRIDHFDSGLGVFGGALSGYRFAADEKTRARITAWLLCYLGASLANGHMATGFKASGYEWCMQEAGLLK